MNNERLSEYAPELYEALKNVLEAIPIIAGDLKPCPFCGGRAELFGTKNSGIFYVKCLECDVDGNFDTPEEARAAWNRRISND